MQQKRKDPYSSQGHETGQSQFESLARNMVRLFDQGAKAASTLAGRSSANRNGSYSMGAEMTEAAKSLGEVARHWVADPSKLVAAQGELFRSYADLWDRSVAPLPRRDGRAVVEPEPGDNRFKDPDWSNTQFFDFWKQAYLGITSRWAEDLTRNTEGIDDKTRKKALFYLNQMLAAFSPSISRSPTRKWSTFCVTPPIWCGAWRISCKTWSSRKTCSASARPTSPPSRSDGTSR